MKYELDWTIHTDAIPDLPISIFTIPFYSVNKRSPPHSLALFIKPRIKQVFNEHEKFTLEQRKSGTRNYASYLMREYDWPCSPTLHECMHCGLLSNKIRHTWVFSVRIYYYHGINQFVGSIACSIHTHFKHNENESTSEELHFHLNNTIWHVLLKMEAVDLN